MGSYKKGGNNINQPLQSLTDGRHEAPRGSDEPECERLVSVTRGEEPTSAVKCACMWRDVYLLSLSFSPSVVAAQCNDFVQWIVVNVAPETQPGCNVESQDWFIGTFGRRCQVWLVHFWVLETEEVLRPLDSVLETGRCNKVMSSLALWSHAGVWWCFSFLRRAAASAPVKWCDCLIAL